MGLVMDKPPEPKVRAPVLDPTGERSIGKVPSRRATRRPLTLLHARFLEELWLATATAYPMQMLPLVQIGRWPSKL